MANQAPSNEDLLLGELLAVVRGAPPGTDIWRKQAISARARWMDDSSNNLPRLSTAVAAASNPVAAAEWWQSLLVEEWGPPGWWDAKEAGGRRYGGWTWAAELASLLILRQRLPGQPVIRLLERSLTRRAAWYALTGVPEVTRHGGRGQVTYRGMGSLTTGGRSNNKEGHDADDVLHRVLSGRRPAVELQPTDFTRILDAIMERGGAEWSGVEKRTRERLGSLVATGGTDLELVGEAVALMGPARTFAPLWVRRYQDGALACAVGWNPSGNTSCAFLVAGRPRGTPLSLRRDIAWLHPYGPHERVRGGTALGAQILGRGETWWEGDTFCCANLRSDMEGRSGPRWEMRHQLPPAASLLWELRTSPEAPPALSVGGRVVTPPPPPAPKPPEPPAPKPPEPKEPPMPPKPKGDDLSIPPKGLHVKVPQGERVAVLRLLPGNRWEFVRWA